VTFGPDPPHSLRGARAGPLAAERSGPLAKAFEQLGQEPRPRPGLDVRPLRGMKGAWRLRIGSYRGIYEKEEGQLRFTRFGHRKDVYRF